MSSEDDEVKSLSCCRAFVGSHLPSNLVSAVNPPLGEERIIPVSCINQVCGNPIRDLILFSKPRCLQFLGIHSIGLFPFCLSSLLELFEILQEVPSRQQCAIRSHRRTPILVTKMRTSLPSGWNAPDLHLAALWVNTHNHWQGLAQTLSRKAAQQMQGVGGRTINIQERCRSSSSIECRSIIVINQSSKLGHQNLRGPGESPLGLSPMEVSNVLNANCLRALKAKLVPQCATSGIALAVFHHCTNHTSK